MAQGCLDCGCGGRSWPESAVLAIFGKLTASDPKAPFALEREFAPQQVNFSDKTLFLILSSTVAACSTDPVDDGSEVPEIVEVFACSDYCPGPEEKYVKRVYDGVTEEKECQKLGGKLLTYIGWGQRTVCEVR